MNASIDLGFGYLKAKANKKEVIFPSVYGEYQHSDFGLLAGRNGYDIQTKDGSWLFGESALLQSALVSRRQDSDWIFYPQYLALMLVAISECISRNTDEVVVDLATGLPYADYSRGKSFLEKFRKCLRGQHEIRRTFGKQTINIREQILIVPQNYGPILRHLLNEKGELRRPETEDKAVFLGSINIGSHTVELGTCEVTLGQSIRINPVEVQSLSEKKGIYSLLPAIRPLLKEQFAGETFSYDRVLKALETGYISLYNKKYTINNIDQPVGQFNERILGLATQNWSDQMPVPLNSLFALIITGGGANLTASYLRDIGYHPNLVVSERPQWDTVKGYERLKKLLDKRK